MKKHIRIGTQGTDGFETSVANQDVLAMIEVREGLTAGTRATMVEFSPKEACVVKINGYTSTIPAGAEYQLDTEWCESFITVTGDVLYFFSATL